jgi:hypothetical protein
MPRTGNDMMIDRYEKSDNGYGFNVVKMTDALKAIEVYGQQDVMQVELKLHKRAKFAFNISWNYRSPTDSNIWPPGLRIFSRGWQSPVHHDAVVSKIVRIQ